MIIRISTEGQYRFPSELLERLNELDNRIVEVVAGEDEAQFNRLYAEMVSLVKSKGELLPHDEIAESEIILPPPDITLQEARGLFVGDGLVAD